VTLLRARWGIDRQIVALVAGAAILAAGAMLSGAFWELGRLTSTAQRFQEESALDAAVDQTSAVHNMVVAQADGVQAKVDSDLQVVQHLVAEAGGISIADQGAITWTATNQFTGETSTVRLPPLVVGDGADQQWLGRNDSREQHAPIVDDAFELVGGTTTVFQRMNDEGDMLRIATDVEKLDGTRAIGTYIPATDPDGSPNPVVETILSGRVFRGTAYTVNAWYVTAYAPLFDGDDVIGIVGVKKQQIESMRTVVEHAAVLESGSVAIVAGSGDDAGQVIVSDRLTEGAPLADAVTGGDPQALDRLLTGAVASPGLPAVGPTVEVAGVGTATLVAQYFEPWDWMVIGIAPQSDIDVLADAIGEETNGFLLSLGAVGAVIVVLLTLAGVFVAGRIARIIRHHAAVTDRSVQTIGNATHTLSATVQETVAQANEMRATSDEVACHAGTVATATEELSLSFHSASDSASQMTGIAHRALEAVVQATDTVDRLTTASTEIDRVTELISSIAKQTNLLALNATIEAARAGAAGKGFSVVANEVKELAAHTASATGEIGRQITLLQAESETAQSEITGINGIIEELSDIQTGLAGIVTEQQATSIEIARNVQEAASRAARVAERATSVATNSEQAVTAASAATIRISELQQVVNDLRDSVSRSSSHDGDDLRLGPEGRRPIVSSDG
jgi:methyl-accepting chemotaxis protein